MRALASALTAGTYTDSLREVTIRPSGTLRRAPSPPPHLTLAFPLTPPLRKKVRQVAGEGLEQLLRPDRESVSERPGHMTRPAEMSHLGGELAPSVKGVQVSDHDVGRFLQRDGAGGLVQGPLLHVGVEGHSPGGAVGRAAAFRGRGGVWLPVHAACLNAGVVRSVPEISERLMG